jgi:hypothetical protein
MPRATQSRRRYLPRRPRRRIRIEAPLPPAPRGWWGVAARLFLAAKSIPIVLLVFAAIVGGLGLRVRHDSDAEHNWPAVPGIVQSVNAIQVACGGYSTHGGSIPRTCTRYRTTYGYEIDGIAYTNFINGIREPDSPLRVYYDPRDPAHSVLDPGGDRSGILMIATGFVLAMLAPVIWARSLRHRWQTTFAPDEPEEPLAAPAETGEEAAAESIGPEESAPPEIPHESATPESLRS